MPYASFLTIHFEVGGDTKNLAHQEVLWPAAIDLIDLAGQYNAHLTLQFNHQWAEYVLRDRSKLDLLRRREQQGHEIGFHHHGSDHDDWDGYTNKLGKEDSPRF